MSVLTKVLEKRWPGVVAEYKFHPERGFKFDYCWPDKMIALEIEGGIWGKQCKICKKWLQGGRHVRGKGYENDCEKYSEAAVLGWRIIRATPAMCKNGLMMGLLERVMG